MEVVHYCQLAAAIELCDFGSRRIEPSSFISHGRVKKRDEFSAVVNTFSFRVSGGIGGCVRGSWQEGRDGALSKRCCFRARGNERLGEGKEELKVCIRCGTAYRDEDNSPVACKYHGHMTGTYAVLCTVDAMSIVFSHCDIVPLRTWWRRRLMYAASSRTDGKCDRSFSLFVRRPINIWFYFLCCLLDVGYGHPIGYHNFC
jgi:hypothetical protein